MKLLAPASLFLTFASLAYSQGNQGKSGSLSDLQMICTCKDNARAKQCCQTHKTAMLRGHWIEKTQVCYIPNVKPPENQNSFDDRTFEDHWEDECCRLGDCEAYPV